jgi:outer membrane protein assembly factor BamB/ankyrin repeat protein
MQKTLRIVGSFSLALFFILVGVTAMAQTEPGLVDVIIFTMVTSEGGGRGDPAGGAIPTIHDILIEAIKAGNAAKAKELLDKGASPNAVHKGGGSAIRWGAYYGHSDLVTMLLNRGAEIKPLKGERADEELILNAIKGDADAIKKISTGRIDINGKASGGETALHWACIMGNEKAVTQLIALGADPNILNKAGCPPLALASLNGHERVVQILLNNGANPEIRGIMGGPEAFARVRGHQKVVNLLRDFKKSGTKPKPSSHISTSPETILSKENTEQPAQSLVWSFKAGDSYIWGPEFSEGVACFMTAAGSDSESGSYIYGLDVSSGSQLWKIKVSFDSCGIPKVANGVVYFGTRGGADPAIHLVCAVEISSGKLLWKRETAGQVVWISEIKDGVVYFSNFANEVTALNANKGSVLWRYSLERQNEELFTDEAVSYLSLSDGVACVAFGSNITDGPGRLVALDTRTGKQIWKISLWRQPSMPLVVDGTVYLGTRDGCLFSIDLTTGVEKWRMSPEKSGLHSGYASVNEIDDGVAYATIVEENKDPEKVSGTLLAIHATSGQLKWKLNGEFGYGSGASVVRSQLFAPSQDGYFYVLDKDTGKLDSRIRYGGEHGLIHNGCAFWANPPGELHAMELEKAPRLSVNHKLVVEVSEVQKSNRSIHVPEKVTEGSNRFFLERSANNDGPAARMGNEVHSQSQKSGGFEPPLGLKWKAPGEVVLSELVLYKGLLLFFPRNELLTAIDTSRGREKFKVPNSWQGGLAVANGMAYFREGTQLFCFDLESQKIKWRQDKWTNEQIVVSDGILVTRTANDDLCAFDSITAKELWDFATGDRIVTMQIYNGMVYAYCHNRSIYGIDLKSGKQKWKLRLEKPEYLTGLFIISDGLVLCKVFLDDHSKNDHADGSKGKYFLMAYDLKTERTRWKIPCQGFFFKPAVAQDILIVEFEQSVSAFAISSGKQLWQRPMPGVNNQPVIIDGVLYVGCDDGKLYAMDIKNGNLKWADEIGVGVRRDRTPLLAGENGMIYVRRPQGGIYAIDTEQAEKDYSERKKSVPNA